MRLIFTIFFIVGLCTCKNNFAQIRNIDNPVLPRVADSGVIRYNGEYYIGGVFTNGSFYISDDLVNWEGPVHVFSMDNDWTSGPSAEDHQIHANDISYVNGVFHQYWSVNHWGRDQHVVHIGHATSPNVLGPYKEPVTDTWLDNRIDPHLFIDDDRKPYLYMVKFTDGNTIWGRPMEDPWTFSGEPRYLFASLRGTWETLDNRVAEGPWVIKYRNRYYMMYNTNHTSPYYGNYTLGVAEADSPLGFHHGSKYPWPVVKSNQLDMEDNFVDLLKYSEKEPGIFTYTTEKPDENWNTLYYSPSGWQKGKTGFGSDKREGSTTRNVETDWKTQELWLRKSFNYNKASGGNLMIRIHHDGTTKVFLNGQLIYNNDNERREYITWNFDKKAESLLKDGENILAIHSTKGRRSNFLDVSLFDLKDQQGDDILFSPGQPNILRGPNGFEWWLIYMANKNAEHRGQYINRVHFFDKTLNVDGITDEDTPGYHPEPAQPTFGELFNEEVTKKWQKKWDINGGEWEIKNKELLYNSTDAARALVKNQPATHYLFEAGVKMSNTGIANAGIYAWWVNEDNWLRVVIDQQQKKWGYISRNQGKTEEFYYSLPDDFNYSVYHTITVYKNAADFSIKIDGLPAPEKPVVKIPAFTGKGIPGLFANGANTTFDGIIYTIGWDEFDDTITGWGASINGIKNSGSWITSKNGIIKKSPGNGSVFKGDLLEEYEVSVQITSDSNEGSAGIYPVYINNDNHLKATFDYESQKLIISGRLKGKSLDKKVIPLEKNESYYADMTYTDFIEKHFTFHSPSIINGIKLNKIPHNQPETLIEDIYNKLDIFYKNGEKWYPLTAFEEKESGHPGFDKIIFEPVKAEALKFVNKEARDRNFYVYKIWVDEQFKESYNFRVAKLKDEIIFLVDGMEVYRMKNDFPASQVGLFSEKAEVGFNGITLFQLNTGTKL